MWWGSNIKCSGLMQIELWHKCDVSRLDDILKLLICNIYANVATFRLRGREYCGPSVIYQNVDNSMGHSWSDIRGSKSVSLLTKFTHIILSCENTCFSAKSHLSLISLQCITEPSEMFSILFFYTKNQVTGPIRWINSSVNSLYIRSFSYTS